MDCLNIINKYKIKITENKNFTLKEKQINKDYYLKRAIIFSLITAIGTPYARFVGGIIYFLADKDAKLTNNVSSLCDAVGAWFFGNAISLVI